MDLADPESCDFIEFVYLNAFKQRAFCSRTKVPSIDRLFSHFDLCKNFMASMPIDFKAVANSVVAKPKVW